ncbi:hydroxylysine kinase [Trichonephila clavata]|uniref:Hydroxylysine kinase n=1 Tax=Trichonephila clavata TaxID=2740835 RepID=A0A8X6JD91_TRICU|nr:hydroxylysine kinase [Trichonephila clavata]
MLSVDYTVVSLDKGIDLILSTAESPNISKQTSIKTGFIKFSPVVKDFLVLAIRRATRRNCPRTGKISPRTAGGPPDQRLRIAALEQELNGIEDFDHAGFRNKTIFWNLEHIPEIRNFMDGMEEHRKKLVLSVLDKYPSEIENNMDRLPRGVIHGDFNENNVLVQVKTTEDNKAVVSVNGVLDFEDVHHGTFVWDVGLMLAYTLLECKIMDPLEGAGHALAGYLSLRSLSPLEIFVLKTCIESRLCQSLVICAHSYRTDPTNAYLLTSAKQGWSRLEQLCNTNKEDLLQKWKEIQEKYASKNV